MFFIYLFLSGLVIIFDQWVKFWTVNTFSLGESTSVIPGFLSFTYVKNTGAAWSILEGQMWFFFIITIVAVIAILYLLYKHLQASSWFTVGLSLTLAGAVGNFIDRMRQGFVVDTFQFDFINFPIFNIADMALVCGVICIFIYMILDEKDKKDGRN